MLARQLHFPHLEMLHSFSCPQGAATREDGVAHGMLQALQLLNAASSAILALAPL